MANRTKLITSAILCYLEIISEFKEKGFITGNDALQIAFLMAENSKLEKNHKLVGPSYFLVAASTILDQVERYELTELNIMRLQYHMFNIINEMDYKTAIQKATQIMRESLIKGTLATIKKSEEIK